MSVVKDDIEDYFNWLRARTKLRDLSDGWTEITTPYIDRHNDYIQIYGRRRGASIELSDDGSTISNLELSGCEVKTGKRRALLETAARGFGVEVEGRELRATADAKTLPLKMHSLVQAVLAVDDLFYLARPHVASLFFEDVVEWLNENEIRYSPGVKISGKSGFDHYYDFIVPKSRAQPERLLTAINNPSKQNAKNFLFAWLDTRESRPAKSQAIAILNDQDGKLVEEFRAATENYEITSVPWSNRNQYVDRLAA